MKRIRRYIKLEALFDIISIALVVAIAISLILCVFVSLAEMGIVDVVE